jgi:putative iron-regulated protein
MKKLFLAVFMMIASFQSEAVTNKEIIQNIATNVILKTYQDMAKETATLKVNVNTFAKNPTQENLDKAKTAWRAARVPWESSESFLFGPVDSLGIDPQVDTWPLNRLDLEGVMSSGRLINLDLVRNLGTNMQGYHTVEYLLFGSGISSNNKAISEFSQVQLDYLVATSTLLAEYSGQLAHAWSTQYNPEDSQSGGYADVISNPSLQNPIYSSERAVLEEYIQGMMGILDEVGNGKISDPFGSDINHANVELVESPYSWNSLADFTNNIRSVHSIYTGSYGAHKGAGIKDYVKAKNASLAQRVEFEILKSMQLIQKISGPNQNVPFRQAILNAEGRQRIQLAIDQLAKTRTLIEENVLPLLD